MNMLTKRLVKSKETASRVIDGEAIIVIPEEGLARVLNEVGSRTWELFDGKNSVGDIIDVIVSEFDVTPKDAESDILDFISELQEKGMVAFSDEQSV